MPTKSELITKIRENGRAVHLDHETGPYLENGSSFPRKVFESLVEDGRLIPGADSLFDTPPQTYYLSEE